MLVTIQPGIDEMWKHDYTQRNAAYQGIPRSIEEKD
jgi:hypothetical protein